MTVNRRMQHAGQNVARNPFTVDQLETLRLARP
jgi:hypothetical protein